MKKFLGAICQATLGIVLIILIFSLVALSIFLPMYIMIDLLGFSYGVGAVCSVIFIFWLYLIFVFLYVEWE